jgi:hypothetical protein
MIVETSPPRRNWLTIASLGSLAALVVYSLLIVWFPQLEFNELSIGILIVLASSSIVTAILSLHFREPL